MGFHGGLEVVWLQPPAEVDTPAHDSRVGTGYIKQHAVELFPNVSARRHHLNTIGTEAFTVFAQALESILANVGGDKTTGVLHAGSDGGGFAAGSSAEIEKGFVGLWIQKLNSQQCAWVLDVKCAVFEAG